jgi:hypothetical protein
MLIMVVGCVKELLYNGADMIGIRRGDGPVLDFVVDQRAPFTDIHRENNTRSLFNMLSRALSLLTGCLACVTQASINIEDRQGNWTIGQTVSTSSGPVEGHAAGNGTGTSEYLGIPYAQPPVGELRFQPPVAFNGTETINGTDYGFVCMQVDMFAGIPHLEGRDDRMEKREGTLTPDALAIIAGYFAGIPATSEDCLTLNVWTKPQVGEEKKAVLVCCLPAQLCVLVQCTDADCFRSGSMAVATRAEVLQYHSTTVRILLRNRI